MSELNKQLIKYGLLIATSPIWYPFLKAVWEELNHALRADGGLLGSLPNRRDRARLAQRPDEEDDPLLNELRGRPGEPRRAPTRNTAGPGRSSGKGSGKNGAKGAAGRGAKSAPAAAPRRRGFR